MNPPISEETRTATSFPSTSFRLSLTTSSLWHKTHRTVSLPLQTQPLLAHSTSLTLSGLNAQSVSSWKVANLLTSSPRSLGQYFARGFSSSAFTSEGLEPGAGDAVRSEMGDVLLRAVELDCGRPSLRRFSSNASTSLVFLGVAAGFPLDPGRGLSEEERPRPWSRVLNLRLVAFMTMGRVRLLARYKSRRNKMFRRQSWNGNSLLVESIRSSSLQRGLHGSG